AENRLTPTAGPVNNGIARIQSGSDVCKVRTIGMRTNAPQSPYTIDGIAASSSVRNTSGWRRNEGQSSERKMAMPSEMGPAMTSARMEEYSVPQMNGNAPNSPETGFQFEPPQKPNSPNFSSASRDSLKSTTPMPQTMSTRTSANAPVPMRKIKSE